METLSIKKIQQTYLVDKLDELMKEFLSEANEYIKRNNFHVSIKSKKALQQMDEIIWSSYFQNSSQRTKKRFVNYFNKFRKKQSRQSLNRMFHFIHTRVLGKKERISTRSSWTGIHGDTKWVTPDWIDKVKIEAPLKHQNIQKKRKLWKEAQAISDKLLAEYKEEKGDYYKMGGK